MKIKGITDQVLAGILKIVHLDYLEKREGGMDSSKEWYDILSGGEKQRIAFSRLFYHRPTFAILGIISSIYYSLDECTSAVSMDVESKLFQSCKEYGITLISVSLRTSLFKHHDYTIFLDGE